MVDVHVRQQHRLDVVDRKVDFGIGVFLCFVALKNSTIHEQAVVVLPKQLVAGSSDTLIRTVMDKFHGRMDSECSMTDRDNPHKLTTTGRHADLP